MRKYDVVVEALDGKVTTEAVIKSWEFHGDIFVGLTNDGPWIMNTRNVRCISLDEKVY